MKSIIPYGKQNINDEDIEAVMKALKSNFLTQGPEVLEFERKFADYIGCDYAVAVSNGTAALHLSTLALGIGNGDTVITTPITFAASANCVKYTGGEVVFSDIDPHTYLLNLDKVRSLLAGSPKGAFRAIIAVDFAGAAVNLEELKLIADEYGLFVIEDACHSPGGYFIDSRGVKQRCGNGKFADLAVFSFHPVKHIACGEGGMITTNSKTLYERLLLLRTHGITKSSEEFVGDIALAEGSKITQSVAYPGWYMEMQTLGYNYRLTDFQAALGSSQLKRADAGLLRRREIANLYSESFSQEDFVISHSGYVQGHAYHLYIIEVKDRLGLYNYLKSKQIYTQIHYFPCHLMPYYRDLGWKLGDLPQSELYYQGCLSLPMYPTLTKNDQLYVINSIKEYYDIKS